MKVHLQREKFFMDTYTFLNVMGRKIGGISMKGTTTDHNELQTIYKAWLKKNPKANSIEVFAAYVNDNYAHLKLTSNFSILRACDCM